jgi:YD repeat-containing protein
MVAAAAVAAGSALSSETDRARDGFAGPVRQVTTTSGGTTTIRTYDRTGALIASISRLAPPADDPDAHEQTRRLIYVYDAEKRRVQELSQDEAEEPSYLSRRYGYDREGRLQAEAAFHMCGTFSSLHVLRYDREGRLVEDLMYQYRSVGRRVYAYDARGYLETLLSYKNGGLQSTVRYQYNAQGRMSEQAEVLPDGSPGSKTSYEYDQGGRLLAEHFVNGLHPLLNATSTYEYDQTGNWTRKTTRRTGGGELDSSHEELTERMFAYF